MNRFLLENAKFYNVLDQTTAGTTAASTGDIILDMEGFDSVCWVGTFRTITAAGTAQIIHMQADSSGSLTACTSAVAGTTGDVSTTDWEQSCVVLDIHNPQARWVSCEAVKNAQNSEISILGILYNSQNLPTSQSTEQYGCLDSLVFTSPTT